MDFEFGDFEKLLDRYGAEVVTYNEGDIATGIIIDVDNKTVTVDIGGKTVGYIPLAEFAGENTEIGTSVEIYIEKVENRKGELIVSRKNARKYQSWNNLKKSMAENQIVKGKILGKVKGGFAIEVGDITAFLPKSQVDTAVLANTNDFVGKTEEFLLLKIDDTRRNVVVSRRAILEEQRSKEREEVLGKIKIGDVITGIVKNITDYGAFIDFGSFDGLLHLTDISWCRVRHPAEVLKIGQDITVQVIKYDETTKKVSLGLKQLQANPWETLEKKYPINTIVKGYITGIAPYGVFVDIENGIEGLVHISEMSWFKNNNASSTKLLSVGQAVNVMVLDINTDHHRISLGIKQCEKNPWKEFYDLHNVGDVVEGVIKNITEFGIFVEFESGVDGLVHVSDISWSEQNEREIMQKYKKNDNIRVLLLSCSYVDERISLGLKQLSNENFQQDLQKLVAGYKVSCLLKNNRRDCLEVETNLGLRGAIKKSETSTDKSDSKIKNLRTDDKIDAFVSSFNPKSGKLILRLGETKAIDDSSSKSKDEDDFDLEPYMNNDTHHTLGSVFENVFNISNITTHNSNDTQRK
jgi:small subunit ribosomal protein S1